MVFRAERREFLLGEKVSSETLVVDLQGSQHIRRIALKDPHRFVEIKGCSQCNQAKFLADFSISAKTKTGRNSVCKKCMAERMRETRQMRSKVAEELMEKTCSRCKETKSPGDFHKNNRNKDGLHEQCKECRKCVCGA